MTRTRRSAQNASPAAVADPYLGRTVRREGYEGFVIGRLMARGAYNDGWLSIECTDGLTRESPADRVILCPEVR